MTYFFAKASANQVRKAAARFGGSTPKTAPSPSPRQIFLNPRKELSGLRETFLSWFAGTLANSPFHFVTHSKQKGISTIAALLMILSLASMGGVMAYMVSAGQHQRADAHSSWQALYVTQAGIEYAVKRIYDGQYEIVNPPGITFGTGSFTVSRSGLTLTITGTVGNAVRVHQVDSPTEADCISVDVSNVNLHDDERRLSDINFNKICLPSITIDKMQLSWVPDGGQKVKKIRIESSTIYDNPAGASSGTLLETTDYTVTNPNNNVINRIDFNQSIEDVMMTLSFIMGDASVKTVTFEVDDD